MVKTANKLEFWCPGDLCAARAGVRLQPCPRCFLQPMGSSHREGSPRPGLALFPWPCFISSLLGSAGRAARPGRWRCLQCTFWGEHGRPRRHRWWWLPRWVLFPPRSFPWKCQQGRQHCLPPRMAGRRVASTAPPDQPAPGLVLRIDVLV